MKVLHISLARVNEYRDPEKWLQRIDFFTGVLEELAGLGCQVQSVHLINYKGTLTRNGVTYHFLPLQNNMSPQLWRYVKRLAPDIVVLHGLVFPFQSLLLTLALPNSIKFVMQHHAERSLRFPKSILQKILDRNKVAAYLFSANGLADTWLRSGQISDKDKIFEVMEVSSRFSPSSAPGMTVENKFKYLWVGRLDRNKDPLTLVNAFSDFLKEFPGNQLQIIFRGGSLLPEIEPRLNDDRNGSIVMVGEVDHGELEQWYREADFIISTSHYEGSGTAVCEGLSCGCIPILSDIPSFSMMTGNGEIGILFKPGDPHSLLQALIKSTKMDLLREREHVLHRFQTKLSFKAIARDMLKFFQTL